MANRLNDRTQWPQWDRDQMLARIAELPMQCRDAWRLGRELRLSFDRNAIRQVVVLGMGGSAIGGALLGDLLADTCPLPIIVVRGYTLPAFVEGKETLVIGCSYSGNTEETLTTFREALVRGTRAVAVTTGGKLAALAQEYDLPIARFDYRSQPRAALGYSFVSLLGIFSRLKLLPDDYQGNVEEAIQVMEAWQVEIGPDVPTPQNTAKSLAERLVGRLPVVYGAGFLTAVANRWKTQFNENSKHWAFFEALPELHHNAVVGLQIPPALHDHVTVLMLRSALDFSRIQARWDVTAELLQREGVAFEVLNGRGKSKLAQMLSLIHFGDYVSYYLALLNAVDPSPVQTIAFLKKRLEEIPWSPEAASGA